MYGDMQRAMNKVISGATGVTESPDTPEQTRPIQPILKRQAARIDRFTAVSAISIGMLSAVRIIFGGLEVAGFGAPPPAQAATIQLPPAGPRYSPEELEILQGLDARRAELEERRRRLEQREHELDERDREFAARFTQLRELTGMLKVDREMDGKKREGQVGQLANVYGSMNPPEAATLLGQLDVTTALSLIEKMPEKRIGQILSLMPPDRALTITKMLTGKAEMGRTDSEGGR